jgi:hypothetical protein
VRGERIFFIGLRNLDIVVSDLIRPSLAGSDSPSVAVSARLSARGFCRRSSHRFPRSLLYTSDGCACNGGGVFLGPILVLKRWADAGQTTGICAGFILIKSISGLAGRMVHGTLEFG